MRRAWLLLLTIVLWAGDANAQTSEQASKITGFAVIESADQRASKEVGFVVLQSLVSVSAASKIVGYIVLSGTAATPTGMPGGSSDLGLGIVR